MIKSKNNNLINFWKISIILELVALINVFSFHLQENFEEMQDRICSAVETGKVPEETRRQHKGFNEWKTKLSPRDHQPIVEVGPLALMGTHFYTLAAYFDDFFSFLVHGRNGY